MKSVSERLAQEDAILREIRMTLSTFRAVGVDAPRRKGAVYASSPITTGLRLYQEMQRFGITSTEESKRDKSFNSLVMQPNLHDGALFGLMLRRRGWPLVIVPGEFFAKGWAQEHYMSLWRQVIVRYARTVALNDGWQWSNGCVEELLIAVQSGKRILTVNGEPYDPRQCANLVRTAVDQIDQWGFDAKPLYGLWRQIQLTLEATRPEPKTS